MSNRYLDGLALGLAAGFIISVLIVWALEDAPAIVQTFLSDHVTHAVTLLAAALALFGISRQVQSNFEMTERARLAKLDAAKATLPIVLSNINRLCKERYYAIALGTGSPTAGARWQISDIELSTLKECIEHADGIEKELMLEICRIYQVLVARWETLEFEELFHAPDVPEGSGALLTRLEQFGAISNWATLKAVCTALFDYARGANSEPTSDAIADDVLHTLGRINTGGPTGSGGGLLTNNGDFRRYVERKVASRRIEFVDDSWDR